MIDAVVGAAIMVVATTSLLYSIEVAERAFDAAGRYPLTYEEKNILKSVNLSGDSAYNFWLENIDNTPRQVDPND